MPAADSAPPPDIDIRRKRVLFRSTHRGMKEMDILLGDFARQYAPGLDIVQTGRFEDLLEQGDNDLYDWITGRAAVPAPFDHDLMRMLRAFHSTAPRP
jgi:antitoxin CptB